MQINLSVICSIAFSPTGQRIVSGGSDKVARIWDVKTGQQMLALEGHTDWLRSVAFSSDGRLIVSGSDDKIVRLWDGETGMEIAALRGHGDLVQAVTFTADDQSIVSCSRDTTIRVWDIKTALYQSTEHENPVVALASATLTDGWLLGPSGELLLWVPTEYRHYLQLSPCTMLIARRRIIVTADKSCFYSGENWSECWQTDDLASLLRSM